MNNTLTYQSYSENKLTLYSMVSTHVAGLFFLPLMPLILGAIAVDFNTSSLQLGTMATFQLSCTALGAALLSKLASIYNCRYLVLLAIFTEFIVNIGSMYTDSIITLTALRSLSGFSQGVLLASAAAIAARCNNTERVYATYNSVLAIFAVLGLLIGAELIDKYGSKGVFSLFAIVDLIAFSIVLKGFPHFFIRSPEVNNQNSKLKQTLQKSSPIKLRPLLSLTFFGIALAGTQTFVERLGEYHGGSVLQIGQYLAGGWFLAIFTPFLVVPLIKKWGGLTPLVGAYIFVACVALTLSLSTSVSCYLIAAALFTPAAVFIEPLQFGILGASDRSGRLAALGPAAISVGSGIGPILMGSLIGAYELKSIGFIASLCFVISILILLPLAINVYKSIK